MLPRLQSLRLRRTIMRFLPLLLLFIPLGCLFCDTRERPIDEDKQIRDVLVALGPSHAADAYGELFKGARAEDLRRLQGNASPTIAVQAAWEEVEHTVPEKQPKEPVRPDPKKLSWFLGFLETR